MVCLQIKAILKINMEIFWEKWIEKNVCFIVLYFWIVYFTNSNLLNDQGIWIKEIFRRPLGKNWRFTINFILQVGVETKILWILLITNILILRVALFLLNHSKVLCDCVWECVRSRYKTNTITQDFNQSYYLSLPDIVNINIIQLSYYSHSMKVVCKC